MLKLAYQYQEQLQQKYYDTIFRDKYKYYNYGCFWDYNFKLSDNSWDEIVMVSVNKDDEVIGYLRAGINRSSDKVSSLGIMSFSEGLNSTFSRDLRQFLVDLFVKFNFRKIEFCVVIGNPAEKMYDKYIEKYGGRVIGISKLDTKLQDNNYYDTKLYEIFREDFFKK